MQVKLSPFFVRDISVAFWHVPSFYLLSSHKKK